MESLKLLEEKRPTWANLKTSKLNSIPFMEFHPEFHFISNSSFRIDIFGPSDFECGTVRIGSNFPSRSISFPPLAAKTADWKTGNSSVAMYFAVTRFHS